VRECVFKKVPMWKVHVELCMQGFLNFITVFDELYAFASLLEEIKIRIQRYIESIRFGTYTYIYLENSNWRKRMRMFA